VKAFTSDAAKQADSHEIIEYFLRRVDLRGCIISMDSSFQGLDPGLTSVALGMSTVGVSLHRTILRFVLHREPPGEMGRPFEELIDQENFPRIAALSLSCQITVDYEDVMWSDEYGGVAEFFFSSEQRWLLDEMLGRFGRLIDVEEEN
jgi:hypothetical protein